MDNAELDKHIETNYMFNLEDIKLKDTIYLLTVDNLINKKLDLYLSIIFFLYFLNSFSFRTSIIPLLLNESSSIIWSNSNR